MVRLLPNDRIALDRPDSDSVFWLQLVELKNGDTYNGHLVNCDTWMNVNLREVICTSKVFCSARHSPC